MRSHLIYGPEEGKHAVGFDECLYRSPRDVADASEIGAPLRGKHPSSRAVSSPRLQYPNDFMRGTSLDLSDKISSNNLAWGPNDVLICFEAYQ